MLLETPQKKSFLKGLHFIVGVGGVITFLASGLYMRLLYHGLRGLDALPRMLFRSSHIYLLLTSLLNLSLGLYFFPSTKRPRIQQVGSILILISPALMLTAFLIEPRLASFERLFAGPGVYAVFVGMLLHLIAVKKRVERRL